LKLTFLTLTLPAFSPVLLLATSDVCHSDLPEEVFVNTFLTISSVSCNL